MAKAIDWIRIKIKALELTWTDFFLALGFICFVPFAALSWLYMVTSDANDIPFKPWMMIVCFSVSMISWGIYFYRQIKAGVVKNHAFFWLFLFFLLLGLVSVLVQPYHITTINVPVRVSWMGYGADVTEVTVYLNIHWIHRMFFAFATVEITTFVYILLFVFPKRLKNLGFLVFVGICIYIFLLVLTVYSYIFEAYKYGPFLKALFQGDFYQIQHQETIKSFIAHRVPYGVCMMLGFLYGLILHNQTRKWYWFLPMTYCFINMIFSFCKTALLLSVLAAISYTFFRLIATFKENKKRNLIAIISLGSVLFLILVVSLISILSKGKVVSFIYKLFVSYTSGETIKTRTYIWANIRSLLSNGWWVIGRGFGTYNHMLYPMNLVNGDDVCPSHSSYYAVLGAGGIFNLIGYLALHVYFVYVFIYCFKIDKVKTIGYSFGFFTFLFYTFTEGVNYLVVFFTFPLLCYYDLLKRQKEQAN